MSSTAPSNHIASLTDGPRTESATLRKRHSRAHWRVTMTARADDLQSMTQHAAAGSSFPAGRLCGHRQHARWVQPWKAPRNRASGSAIRKSEQPRRGRDPTLVSTSRAPLAFPPPDILNLARALGRQCGRAANILWRPPGRRVCRRRNNGPSPPRRAQR
jgi:hypothetical protein